MNHNSYTNDKRFKSFLELIIKRLVNGSGRKITVPKRREQRGLHKGKGKLTVKKTLRRCLVMSSHSPFCHLSVKRWKEKKREGKTERKKQI